VLIFALSVRLELLDKMMFLSTLRAAVAGAVQLIIFCKVYFLGDQGSSNYSMPISFSNMDKLSQWDLLLNNREVDQSGQFTA
jgi:hypothetical protein